MKEHAQTISSIAIILAVVAGLTLFFAWHNNNAEAPLKTTEKNLITIQPTMMDITEDSYLFGASGSYPQFSQASDAFNKEIADAMQASVNDFKTSAGNDYEAHLKMGGDDFQKEFTKGNYYEYQMDTTTVQSNDDMVSVVIHVGGYDGGAHGYQNVFTFNYDVKKQKDIHLSDLLSLKDASVQSRAQLTKKFLQTDNQTTLDSNLQQMLDDGTDPTSADNFQDFTTDGKNVTLYFPEYQVAPYVYGEQTVTIPISDK